MPILPVGALGRLGRRYGPVESDRVTDTPMARVAKAVKDCTGLMADLDAALTAALKVAKGPVPAPHPWSPSGKADS